MAAPVWLLALGRWVVRLLTRPAVQEAARDMAETVIDEVLHRDEPSRPLPSSAVQEQQRQIDAATSYKVPCSRPNPGWTCARGNGHSGPCAATEGEPTARQADSLPQGPTIVKAKPRTVDRERRTSRPKPPRP